MLRLSAQQMAANAPETLERFDRRAVAILLRTYGETHEIDRDRFPADVTRAREYAQSLGFRCERHLLDVMEAYLLWGGKVLKSDPGFLRIVEASLLTWEEKARRVRRRFVQRHPAYRKDPGAAG